MSQSITISIPNKLAEKIKPVIETRRIDIDEFVASAITQRLLSIQAEEVRERLSAQQAQLTPEQAFERLVSEIRMFERKYGINTEEFHHRFHTGTIDDDPPDFYRWWILHDSLKRMKERFGFDRESIPNG